MLLAATQLLAATATDVVPRTAPRGARVVFLGSGFDTALPEVTFAAANGRVAAPLISRSSNFLEVAVPQAAMTGEVKVTAGGVPLATFAFTVAPAPPFVKSATLVRDVLKQPSGAFVALPTGAVYVADTLHHQMKVIAPNGQVQVVAGTGNPGFIDGPASIAQFNAPRALAIDRARNVVYVADTGNHAIRAVTATGVMTFAGSGRPEDRDGTGQQAGFKQPSGLAIDRDGNLYVADTGNEKIRKVTPAGVVTTVAGLGRPGLANGGTADALFNQPSGVAIADNGVLYVADTANHVIRKIENGLVSTFAGTGHPGSIDGPSNNAEFKEPAALALDEVGDLLIADSGNNRIRVISNGIVSTVAGTGNPGLIDGNDLANTQYKQPSGIATEGAVFIADTMNDALRVLYRAMSATDVYPRSGDPNGGDAVRIFGAGFVPGKTTVLFGGAAAQATYVSSTEMMVTTPAGAIGTTSITVSTPAGAATLHDAYKYAPPFVSITVTPSQFSLNINQSMQLSASGLLSGGGTADLTSGVTWTSTDSSVATVDVAGLVRGIRVGSATIAASFASLTGIATVTVRDPNAPPADPSTIAPALDPGISTSTYESTKFLYSGPNAIQHDVAPGAIEPLHVAILRGRVLGSNGQPLAGVRVTVPENSGFGWTGTRLDGWFDLALNGGGAVNVRLEKEGFLPVERQAQPSWQGYAAIDDVVLIPVDPVVTPIIPNASEAQIARGSLVTDDDGARQATMVFAAGTTASMQMADGTSVPLSSLHVRATEYTVGDNGPKAMPAPLPPTSGYTYCVELSVDEARSAGAATVQFSKPVSYYVQNFIGFPIGSKVPSAYYDSDRQVWVPTPDGRVVRITAIESGAARVDTDGDNAPDDSGIDLEERQKLAILYSPGTSLWRVSLSHFTPYDFNWAIAAAGGGVAPTQPPVSYAPKDNCCKIGGSIIESENQTLGEVIPVTGTPFSLHYSSDRVPGRVASRTMDIRITESQMPASALRSEIEISVAGRITRQTFSASPNQKFRYVWDGLDAYGRTVTSGVPVRVTITYAYAASYLLPPQQVGSSFGLVGGIKVGIPARDVIEFSRTWEGTFPPTWDATSEQMGGWTIGPHHFYDVASRTLYRGDGTRRNDLSQLFGIPQGVIRTIAGGGRYDGSQLGDGQPAKGAGIGPVHSVAFARDGTMYLSATGLIYKVALDGKLTRVAGKLPIVYPTDVLKTQPATDAQFYQRQKVSVGRDGSLYVAEGLGDCSGLCGVPVVRRIRPDGMITPFAGNGERGTTYVDGVPALEARLNLPVDVVAGPDGSVYIADNGYSRILRVGPDGILRSIAGNGNIGFSGDGGPATAATLNRPRSIALGVDGSIYFLEAQRIRRIGTDGTITTVAGTGVCRQFGSTGDGGPAVNATMCATDDVLAVAADGSIYIGTADGIRRVDPAGVISTVTAPGPKAETMSPDGTVAAAANVTIFISAIALGPDGTLYYVDHDAASGDVVRRIESSLPSFDGSASDVPIADNGLLHVFDENGRHLRTLIAETGGELYRFHYSPAGLLTSIVDIDGNITTIERSGGGDATAVIAPGGQRTEIAGTPYATSIAAAAGETMTFTYTPSGLMTSMTDARQNTTMFDWNELGLLKLDADPEGGFKSLARTETATGHLVTIGTGEGRTESYRSETTATGDDSRAILKTGTSTSILTRRSGLSTTTLPDGSTLTTRESADPIWGAQSMFASQVTLSLPSGRSTSTTLARTAVISDAANPLASFVRTDRFAVNGKTFTRVFDRASLTETLTSPMQRTVTTRFDAASRIRSVVIPSVAPLEYSYDAKGRLEATTQGTRSIRFTYTPNNDLETMRDALGRVTRFSYDGAGRILKQVLPGSREILFAYDAAGNLASVTPPLRPGHVFGHNKVNLTSGYTPPALNGAVPTLYTYNKDRELTAIERPGGSVISLGYAANGRLQSITWPGRALTYGYFANGNLASVTGGDATMSYTWDGSFLTSMSWTGAISAAVQWTYDANMQLATEGVDDSTVSFAYDADGLLMDVGQIHLYRTAAGIANGTSLGSTADHATLNAYAETENYTATYADTQILGFEYNRDAAGRITGVTEHGQGGDTYVGYAYDDAGRLRDAFYPAVNIHYEYDPNGNRIARQMITSSGTVTESAAYDDQDRLVNYEGVQFTYTASGELLTKSDSAGVTKYAYDAVGNLRSVTLPDGTAIDYLIDGQNRRVGKKVNGTLVAGWLYSNQSQIVAELDGNGKLVSRFVYASRANVPDYMIRDNVTYRIFSDHLGSPRVVVNTSSGAVAARMQYDEFGNVTYETSPVFIPFGFAGGLYDRQTRLLRFGARDYDPRIGRWTTKDPIGFGGNDSNLYSYVYNDPINLIDPSGLDAITSDPHALSIFASLFKKAGYGNVEWEESMLLLQNPQTGKYLCLPLKGSHAANKNKTKVIRHPWAVAYIHTHPTKRTDAADQGDDPAAATGWNLPLYVLHRNGIHKILPGAAHDTEELNADAYRKQNNADWFNFVDQDSCGCK
jgi:RHS repeat-associated protein